MTLQVAFDAFADTVKRLLNLQEAYVSPHDAGSLVTSAKPEQSIVVASVAPMSPEVATSALQAWGMSVFPGAWLSPDEIVLQGGQAVRPYIAAVSYRSSGDRAGVWVDAFPALPTQVAVLKSMYDEFRATGELDEIPFEEFTNLANPNVVIVSPPEIDGYLRQKEEC